jgi:hypothetical protein
VENELGNLNVWNSFGRSLFFWTKNEMRNFHESCKGRTLKDLCNFEWEIVME